MSTDLDSVMSPGEGGLGGGGLGLGWRDADDRCANRQMTDAVGSLSLASGAGTTLGQLQRNEGRWVTRWAESRTNSLINSNLGSKLKEEDCKHLLGPRVETAMTSDS